MAKNDNIKGLRFWKKSIILNFLHWNGNARKNSVRDPFRNHTCPRVKIKGGLDFQNRWGAPLNFEFYCIFMWQFQKFSQFWPPSGGRGWGLRGLRGGSYPPSPPLWTRMSGMVIELLFQIIMGLLGAFFVIKKYFILQRYLSWRRIALWLCGIW